MHPRLRLLYPEAPQKDVDIPDGRRSEENVIESLK